MDLLPLVLLLQHSLFVDLLFCQLRVRAEFWRSFGRQVGGASRTLQIGLQVPVEEAVLIEFLASIFVDVRNLAVFVLGTLEHDSEDSLLTQKNVPTEFV